MVEVVKKEKIRRIDTSGPEFLGREQDRVYTTIDESEFFVSDVIAVKGSDGRYTSKKVYSGNTGNHSAAVTLQASRREQISKEMRREALHYLISDTAILKVDLIHPDVTPDQFREIFERFGAVKRSGILVGNGSKTDPQYMLVRRTIDLDHFRPQGWSEWTGVGYVEMDTAFAKEAMAYWTSPDGIARARGERGLTRETLTVTQTTTADGVMPRSGGLVVQEDKLFDPWEWKWR